MLNLEDLLLNGSQQNVRLHHSETTVANQGLKIQAIPKVPNSTKGLQSTLKMPLLARY